MTLADLENRYPAISDLAHRARRRTPHFAWEYLDSGTGRDEAMHANETALANVQLTPRFLKGEQDPALGISLFGQHYDAPIGMAPVGMTGLMWPGAEAMLARTASEYRIPYCLSTVTAATPEEIGPIAGDMGWFQLYPPGRADLRQDILKRAKDAGFRTLVLTVDIPTPSRRERQRRSGMSIQSGVSKQMLSHIAQRPAWALAVAKHGKATLATIAKYAGSRDLDTVRRFFVNEFSINPDWRYVETLRQEWDGPLVVKGVLSAQDAIDLADTGVDGIWVSNHGGRQFDAAPAAITVLPDIVHAVGARTKIIFDSGIRSGLDIARALALGADFCFAGRAFLYGVTALQQPGAALATHILIDDLRNAMIQAGCPDLRSLKDRLA